MSSADRTPTAPPVSIALSVAAALLWIPQAFILAATVAALVEARPVAGGVAGAVVSFLVLGLIRAALEAIGGRIAARAASDARRDLRRETAEKAARWSPFDTTRPQAGETAAFATDQAEVLEPYIVRWAPARWRVMVVPPAIALVVLMESWAAAIVLVLAFPFIPLFQSLIGAEARDRSQKQLSALGTVTGALLDRVAGMTTIRLFGAVPQVAGEVAAAGDRIRERTLSVLKLAFLSSAVLELFSAVAVALVAVYVGFNLLGWIDFGATYDPLTLASGLFILFLAPDFFQPLRDFAAAYHDRAAADALAARRSDLLDAERPRIVGTGASAMADLAFGDVVLDAVAAGPADRPMVARLDLTVRTGERVALYGPSGSGKSTLLALVAGLLAPTGGSVTVAGRPVDTAGADAVRGRIAWIGQSPVLLPASLRDNVALFAPGADDAAVTAALDAAAFGPVLDRLPAGLDTRLGENGTGLSGGELRRLALARAILSDRPLVLADEPTASLDAETADLVRDALDRLAEGRTLIVATHDDRLAERMDRVVTLSAGRVASERAAPAARTVIASDRPCRSATTAATVPIIAAPADAETSGTVRDILAIVARFAGRAPGRLVLGFLLLLATLASGIGLLTASGALIAGCALAGAGLIAFDTFRPSAAIRFFAISRTIARYGERVVGHDATLRILSALRVDVFRGLAARPQATGRDADALARLSGDLEVLDGLHLRIAAPIAAAAVGLAVVATVLALVSPTLAALVVGPALVGGLLLPIALGLGARRDAARRHAALDRVRAAIVALDRGRVEFAVAGRLGDASAAVDAAADEALKVEQRLQRREALLRGLALASGQAAIAGAVVGVAPLVADGSLSAPFAAAAVTAAFGLGELLQPVRTAALDLGRLALAAGRLAPLVAEPPAADEPAAVADPAPVRFDAIAHVWPDGRRALEGVSLALAPGERLALVGPSGSGKSTLLQIAAGLVAPTGGRMLVDGGPLVRPGLAASGATVGLLTQRTELFAGSIADNLRLADPDADDRRLWTALERAGLDAVVRDRGGLDAVLGEGGNGLSGGEARRLALARLLVLDPAVVLLDEPTEGLDADTAAGVIEALARATAGRTLIVATHRPDELRLASRVVHVDGHGVEPVAAFA